MNKLFSFFFGQSPDTFARGKWVFTSPLPGEVRLLITAGCIFAAWWLYRAAKVGPRKSLLALRFAIIGLLFDALVESTVAVTYEAAACAPSLVEPELEALDRFSASHLFLSTSARYGPLFTSASALMACMMHVIMLTSPMLLDVASCTWLVCGST